MRVGDAIEAAIEHRPGVRAIGQTDGVRHPLPVLDLPLRVGIGIGVAGAAGARVAVEIFELRRELADDACLALRRQLGKAQAFADERLPITHRPRPSLR